MYHVSLHLFLEKIPLEPKKLSSKAWILQNPSGQLFIWFIRGNNKKAVKEFKCSEQKTESEWQVGISSYEWLPTCVFHYLLHLNFIFYKLSSKHIKTLFLTVLNSLYFFRMLLQLPFFDFQCILGKNIAD